MATLQKTQVEDLTLANYEVSTTDQISAFTAAVSGEITRWVDDKGYATLAKVSDVSGEIKEWTGNNFVSSSTYNAKMESLDLSIGTINDQIEYLLAASDSKNTMVMTNAITYYIDEDEKIHEYDNLPEALEAQREFQGRITLAEDIRLDNNSETWNIDRTLDINLNNYTIFAEMDVFCLLSSDRHSTNKIPNITFRNGTIHTSTYKRLDASRFFIRIHMGNFSLENTTIHMDCALDKAEFNVMFRIQGAEQIENVAATSLTIDKNSKLQYLNVGSQEAIWYFTPYFTLRKSYSLNQFVEEYGETDVSPHIIIDGKIEITAKPYSISTTKTSSSTFVGYDTNYENVYINAEQWLLDQFNTRDNTQLRDVFNNQLDTIDDFLNVLNHNEDTRFINQYISSITEVTPSDKEKEEGVKYKLKSSYSIQTIIEQTNKYMPSLITTNGSDNYRSYITVNENAYMNVTNGQIIYIGSNILLTLNGGTFIGGTPIVLRGGVLNIPPNSNPTIIGTEKWINYDPNHGGQASDAGASLHLGHAIAIEGNGTRYGGKEVSANIQSGRFISHNNTPIGSYGFGYNGTTYTYRRITKFLKCCDINKPISKSQYIAKNGTNPDFDILADDYLDQYMYTVIPTKTTT